MKYEEEIVRKYLSLMDSTLSGFEYTKAKTPTGFMYHLEGVEAVLDITVATNWIGYDLTIKPDIMGKKFGSSLDTDSYTLDYDPGVTEEIADEVILCCKAFVKGQIYIGQDGKKRYLAIPVRNGYKIETMGRFIKDVSHVGAEEVKANKMLRPIK